MTRWPRPAELLPVQVRPVGGETVVSYVFRLADANGFARPTLLLRAIGEPIANNIHAGLLEHHDITLNAPALARLAAMTGRSTTSLGKTLPSLGTASTDRRLSSATEPLINPFSSAAIREHCQHCIARIPGHPNIRVQRGSAPAICGRHHRWVDTTRQHPNQVDLANNLEIITAHRRFQRLPATVAEPAWARTAMPHNSDRHPLAPQGPNQLLRFLFPRAAHLLGHARPNPAIGRFRHLAAGDARGGHPR